MQLEFLLDMSPLFADNSQMDIRQMDAIAFLGELPPATVDLIVTDPAYCSLEKHRSVGTTTRLQKAWFPVVQNSYYPEFLAHCYRVLKADSHCYIFCDEETRDVLKPLAIAAGFTFWKSIVWDKGFRGMGWHYANSYEFVIFLEKGKRNLNTNHFRDVLQHRSVSRLKNAYPTEKPVSLMEILISESSHEGELVIDPFLGSGATGVAALNLKRRFAGCDILPKSIQRASERMIPLLRKDIA